MKDRTAEVLPQALLDKIAAVAAVRTFPKRAIIVTEGDDTDSLYVLLSGKARVFVADDKGREVQLNQLGAGEHFGEVTRDGGERSPPRAGARLRAGRAPAARARRGQARPPGGERAADPQGQRLARRRLAGDDQPHLLGSLRRRLCAQGRPPARHRAQAAAALVI